jgi:hypothetical protein
MDISLKVIKNWMPELIRPNNSYDSYYTIAGTFSNLSIESSMFSDPDGTYQSVSE